MPLIDDEREAFVAQPLWHAGPEEPGDAGQVLYQGETARPRRIGRSLLIGFALLVFLTLGALGLGYALSSWLGHGNFSVAPDVAKPSQVPAVPESLEPTGAVGPPRLTVQPPALPMRIMLSATPSTANIASAPVAANGAAAQAQVEAGNAGSVGNNELGKLLQRARRCLAEQDYACAQQNARAALRLDRQGGAARKLLNDVNLAQQPARPLHLTAPESSGAAVLLKKETVKAKSVVRDVLKEFATKDATIPREFPQEPKVVLPPAEEATAVPVN